MGAREYAVKKQEIDSLLQNFDWETNPEWQTKLNEIQEKINYFWSYVLKR